jgi:outer membrane scaffolding protein for murein synthesis (MipA/OmpV family)
VARRAALVAIALCAVLAPHTATSVERPLWEAGVGATGLYLPDYRGANQSRGYVFPLPFFAYRGEYLRVDREGIRGIFFQSDRVELDVSLFGTPPVDSSDNTARQGMPDLDATVEVGPVLVFTLARDRRIDYNYRLQLRLPFRTAIATDFAHWHNIGWVAYPHLNLDVRPEFLGGRWNVGLSAGPTYATQKFHQYFYGVAPQFATPARPAYDAPGGYSGATFFATTSRRFEKFWVGAYVRYDNLSGAVFDSSPLVKQNHAWAGGIAIAWVFAESGTKVTTPD